MNRFIYSTHNSSPLPNFVENSHLNKKMNNTKSNKSLPSFSISDPHSFSLRSHHLYSYPLKRTLIKQKLLSKPLVNSIKSSDYNETNSSRSLQNNSSVESEHALLKNLDPEDIFDQVENTNLSNSVSLNHINNHIESEVNKNSLQAEYTFDDTSNSNYTEITQNENIIIIDEIQKSEPQSNISNESSMIYEDSNRTVTNSFNNTELNSFNNNEPNTFNNNESSSFNFESQLSSTEQSYSALFSQTNSFPVDTNRILSYHIEEFETPSNTLRTSPTTTNRAPFNQFLNTISVNNNQPRNFGYNINRENLNNIEHTRHVNPISSLPEISHLRNGLNFSFRQPINYHRTQSYSRSSFNNNNTEFLCEYNFPTRSQSSNDRIINSSSQLLTPLPTLSTTNSHYRINSISNPFTVFYTGEIESIPPIYTPRLRHEDYLYMLSPSPYLEEIRFQQNLIFFINEDPETETHGLDSRVIDIMPVEKFDQNIKYNEALKICGICSMEYEHDECLRRLPCCHAFHKSCIDIWLEEHTSCPLCRFDINEAINLTRSSI